MQRNVLLTIGATGMENPIRYISPECRMHDHVECTPNQKTSPIKCECLCHKLVGEWCLMKKRDQNGIGLKGERNELHRAMP